MKITSLIENTSQRGLPVEHGLSLYIESGGKHILFDMGQSALFAENAERLGVSIRDVDVAVISHGHYDHGGGLQTFLSLNEKAKVYIHQKAFEPHYSLRDTGLRYIGLKQELMEQRFCPPITGEPKGVKRPLKQSQACLNYAESRRKKTEGQLKDEERLVFCQKKTEIDNDMILFAGVTGCCCRPVGNRLLFGPAENVNDDFCHEQNLIIREGDKTVLFAGCAHNGIVNILQKATEQTGTAPTHVLAGMHLVKSGLSEAEEDAFIAKLAAELMKYDNTQFYTMHCTGETGYNKLKATMGAQIEYLSCGDKIKL